MKATRKVFMNMRVWRIDFLKDKSAIFDDNFLVLKYLKF